MVEDRFAAGGASREGWLFPHIFRTFRVALDPKKLVLAAAGIVAMALGWWLISVAFYSAKSEPPTLPAAPTAADIARKYENKSATEREVKFNHCQSMSGRHAYEISCGPASKKQIVPYGSRRVLLATSLNAGRERTCCAREVSASPKPPCRILPRDAETLPELSPVATPSPNPALEMTPFLPFAPPVPLPAPPPDGKSNDPTCAIVTGFPWVSAAGTPLGSPNPPVCTFCGAAAIVGGAELPVENTLVRTS